MSKERFVRSPNQVLMNIFNANRVNNDTPNSSKVHPWFRTGIALINKTDWKASATALLSEEAAPFYKRYTAKDEFIEWLAMNINPENPDDRTVSALAQLYAVNRAPINSETILEGFLGIEQSFFAATATDTSEVVPSHTQMFTAKADESVGVYIQDWTLSRTEDPIDFLRLVYRKLAQNGLYVVTDRKPFDSFADNRFDIDGIARIWELREIKNDTGQLEQYLVPKIFFRNLAEKLKEIGLKVLFSTSQLPDCDYDVVIAVKTDKDVEPVMLNDLVHASWDKLIKVRDDMKKLATK